MPGALLDRNGEFGTVEADGGSRLTACLPASVAAGEAVKIALRPENMRLGANGAAEPNTFTAQVAAHRYQGTQTVYELDVLGGRIDALELGTHRALSGGQRDRGGAAAGPVLGLSRAADDGLRIAPAGACWP